MSEQQSIERFIPYTRSELADMLASHTRSTEDRPKLHELFQILQSIYHFQFHQKLEYLKDQYFPFNPDRCTHSRRPHSPEELRRAGHELAGHFDDILVAANYEKVSPEDLERAMNASALFKTKLYVDFNDFSDYVLYRRGLATERVVVPKWWIFQEEIEIAVYERVAMLIKLQDGEYFRRKKRRHLMFEPGSVIIKLFKKIPADDMEMLFPNVQIRMRLMDLLILGVGAIGGGVGVLLKTSAGLLAMMTVLWYMATSFANGDPMPHLTPGQITAMVGGVTAIGVITGFILRQLGSYRFQKIRFMKALADSLYFKNLDNNAGVFHHLIDAAEEEECKEAMLAYHFLLCAKSGLTEAELDRRVEHWLASECDVSVDFEVADALRKLKALELCREVGKDPAGDAVYQVLPLDEARALLDRAWDDFFQFQANEQSPQEPPLDRARQ